MKILGLDIGEKRIGIAISDALGIIAQGLETFYRENPPGIIEKLRKIVKEEGVSAIVVGLPLNMDGTEGPKAKEAINFANELKKEIELPVKLWDERLSTVEVERLMISAGASRAKRKKKIDKLAAQVILQGYLDSRKHE
ncbi:MAG: Holliday junction resolvase RuvX [Candidatus Omnitrophica bacterium]|nr:Holliday junction resolvase RuvX [Candidatus Omnitrophota bacterium]